LGANSRKANNLLLLRGRAYKSCTHLRWARRRRASNYYLVFKGTVRSIPVANGIGGSDLENNRNEIPTQSEVLVELAERALSALENIANAASAGLGQKPSGLSAMATINQATAEKVVQSLRDIHQGRELDCRKLMHEPAIARLVIVDDDDNREELYISRAGTVDPVRLKLCSYLSPKGQLASFSVGDYKSVRLPAGTKNFEVIEKATFSPGVFGGEWDSRPAIVHLRDGPPLTIKSLRELLIKEGFSEDEVDELERQLAKDDAANNVVAGLQHSTLTAMQMRLQAILDPYQSEIFRLPLDSRLAILGPPGSGKTTTLIKRLRQKLDFAFLEPDERALVEQPGPSGFDHAHSWLMFTPTTLLKEYVKAAFNKEDVPVTDERIQTWEDYRRVVARRSLPILRSGNRKGMVIRAEPGILKTDTISNQIEWFTAFTAFEQELFLKDLGEAAGHIAIAKDTRIGAIGQQIVAAIERSQGRPSRLISELATILEELQRLASNLRDQSRQSLRRILGMEVRKNPDFLDTLARFIATLTPENEDDLDDPDGDDDEEEAVPVRGLRAAEATFIRALRAKAVSQVNRRASSKTSRNAHVLVWLSDREVSIPSLAEIGSKILLHRAMAQIAKAPSDFVANIPARYRRFRREAVAEGQWYDKVPAAADVDALELDLVILAMFRAAGQIGNDPQLMRRLGDRVPAILDNIGGLRRNQILVDEATDFSPIQLACMAALADPKIESFFAIGDFNQRLTTWGSRSTKELKWLFKDIEIRQVEIVYRQSRKLNEFANRLVSAGEDEATAQLPEFMENEGVSPVLGTGLANRSDLAAWLAMRIREIEQFSQQLPSIAVLVNQESELQPLADALNEALADQTIRAIACPKGQAIGPENDVRVFEVKHIKGLEFEAIFFVDIDTLAKAEPELFERYIYVGATRAATFLGLTCAGGGLPKVLEPLSDFFDGSW
jgi:UvrD-like helicase C-terminal domain